MNIKIFPYNASAEFTCCRLEYEQKRNMESPIEKLKLSVEFLEKEVKEIQKKEHDAKLSAEQIVNQMEELTVKADGTVDIAYFLFNFSLIEYNVCIFFIFKQCILKDLDFFYQYYEFLFFLMSCLLN